MKISEKIHAASTDPEELEQLYRADRKSFVRDYREAFADETSPIYRCWAARLEYGSVHPYALSSQSLGFLIALCVVAGAVMRLIIAKEFNWDDSEILMTSFFMMPFVAMMIFTLHQRGWHRGSSLKSLLLTFVVWAWVVFFPQEHEDTYVLSILFAPFVLWSALGLARLGKDWKEMTARLDYLQFFGEFILVAIVLSICGGVLVGLVAVLLEILKLDSDFALEYVAVFGCAAIPAVASWATDRYSAAGRLAPLVAQLFAPLLLIVVVAYLVAATFSVQELFNVRSELLIFNILLLCVLGVAVFSLTGMRGERTSSLAKRVVLWLLVLTAVLDTVAVSAIGWRLWIFGVSANRLVVLGSNLVVFGNLVLIARQYFNHLYRGGDLEQAESSLARYLPAYTAWSLIVFFLFPVIFRY